MMPAVPDLVQPVQARSDAHPARLEAVDGWRAVAVLGVLWWHSWIHTGNPSLSVPVGSRSVNLERCLVLLGNGVHLFFVLSGFCICLSLAKGGAGESSIAGMARFVAHRWRRLSPAFYVVSLATAAALAVAGELPFSLGRLAAHAVWLGGVWPGTGWFSPAFWSLQVEWEFYLVAPLLVLPMVRRGSGWLALAALGLSLGYAYYAHSSPDGTAWRQDEHLPVHFAAFFWGAVAAEGWLHRRSWFFALRGRRFLALGFVAAFAGRGLGSTDVFLALGRWGTLGKVVGEPLMALGFAIMIVVSLNAGRARAGVLGSRALQWIGKRSYSLYLWHWWPCVWIGHALRAHWGATVEAHYATLVLATAVCVPLAWVTYRYCEQPYFRARS